MSGFTAFDFIVIGILLISLLVGFRKGFTAEFLGLAAWAGAIFVTATTMPITTEFAQTIIPVVFIANIVALAMTFFLSLWLLSWLAGFLGKQIRTSLIGPLDRGLGAFFGVLRGVLVIAAGFLLFSYFVDIDSQPDWVKNGKLYGEVVAASETVAKVIPDVFDKAKEFTEGLDPDTRDILEAMEPNQPVVDDLVEQGAELAVEYSDEIREELDNLLDDVEDEAEENGG